MRPEPTCPRCRRAVHPPGLWSSAWECDVHGAVVPLQGVRPPSRDALEVLLDRTRVPIWIPWPLPANWLVTGFADAGDERTGAVACAVALSGPAPLGGVGELIVVAEELGVGLGARLAAMDGPDPGSDFDAGPVDRKVRYEGHEIALWRLDAGDERAAYAGEALGNWLWFVLNPADTGLLMCELSSVRDLRDVRDGGAVLDPPFGALSPFLTAQLALE